jgi:hypothetical protein
MIYTNTIILMVIAFILGFLVSRIIVTTTDTTDTTETKKIKETLVNLDDSRKIELSKCCADDKCYSKPPYLRTDCIKNKEEAFKKLENMFTEMYTQEEYYKKLEENNLIKDKSNFERDVDYMKKFNAKISIGGGANKLDDMTFTKMRMDGRDEVKGYDKLF